MWGKTHWYGLLKDPTPLSWLLIGDEEERGDMVGVVRKVGGDCRILIHTDCVTLYHCLITEFGVNGPFGQVPKVLVVFVALILQPVQAQCRHPEEATWDSCIVLIGCLPPSPNVLFHLCKGRCCVWVHNGTDSATIPWGDVRGRALHKLEALSIM